MRKDTAYYYIDLAAGEARARYISTGPGMEMTYHLKSSQAKEFAAAGYTGAVPPFVQLEADITGMNPQQAAEYIIGTENAWVDLAVVIERIRRSAKYQVEQATDPNVISQIQQTAINELSQI